MAERIRYLVAGEEVGVVPEEAPPALLALAVLEDEGLALSGLLALPASEGVALPLVGAAGLAAGAPALSFFTDP